MTTELHPSLILFLLQAIVISLSGVMMPGPVTAATLGAGVNSKHAGAMIALGHGVIEFPLMALIMAGMGTLFNIRGVKVGIGIVGGAMLLIMGIQMFKTARHSLEMTAQKSNRRAVVTGIILTGGNPYFLLWWATVGLALATKAASFGILAFGIFAVVHWLCDLVWLEALSLASFRGTKLLSDRHQRIVLGVFAVVVVVFAVYFIGDGIRTLLADG